MFRYISTVGGTVEEVVSSVSDGGSDGTTKELRADADGANGGRGAAGGCGVIPACCCHRRRSDRIKKKTYMRCRFFLFLIASFMATLSVRRGALVTVPASRGGPSVR